MSKPTKKPAMGTVQMMSSEDGSTVTIHIDGYIGWYHDKHEMRTYLEGKTPTDIVINITSEGGDPLTAVGGANYIQNFAQQVGATITTIYTGFAASSATVYGGIGTVRKVMSNCALLFHYPSMYAFGTTEEIAKQNENLKTIENLIVASYVKTSGKSEADIRALLKEDKWITPQEALEYGLVTEIIEAVEDAETVTEMSSKMSPVFTMLGYPQLNQISKSNKSNNLKMTIQEKLLAAGYKSEQFNGKTETEMTAMLDLKPEKKSKTLMNRLKNVFTPEEEVVSTEEIEEAILETATMTATNADEIAGLKNIIAEMKKGTTHAPTSVPNTTPQMHTPNLNASNGLFMLGAAQREEHTMGADGTPFGFIPLTKMETQDQSNLNALECLAMKAKVGNSYNMSVISDPAQADAWDFTEILAELGGAESVQVMNDIFARYQEFSPLAEVFTIEVGIKHIRRGIDGEMSSVVRPFNESGNPVADVYDWSMTKQEVHACMAVIKRNAFEFARTYLAKLQTTGFTPFNYPAALHLMELFANRIMKDITIVAFKGVRNSAGTTLVDSINGYIKQAGDIIAAGTNGMVAVGTGAIYPVGTPGATFYHDKVMEMVEALPEASRNKAMVIPVAPKFARALWTEYITRHIYTQNVTDTQKGPITSFLIDGTNTRIVAREELVGSQLLVCTAQSNMVVSYDSKDDTNRVYTEDKLFTQKIGVAFQLGFDFKRIKTDLITINDQ